MYISLSQQKKDVKIIFINVIESKLSDLSNTKLVELICKRNYFTDITELSILFK